MTTLHSDSKTSARLKIFDEHVRLENARDLHGIMGTFGETARYDDEPWGARYIGAFRRACRIAGAFPKYWRDRA